MMRTPCRAGPTGVPGPPAPSARRRLAGGHTGRGGRTLPAGRPRRPGPAPWSSAVSTTAASSTRIATAATTATIRIRPLRVAAIQGRGGNTREQYKRHDESTHVAHKADGTDHHRGRGECQGSDGGDPARSVHSMTGAVGVGHDISGGSPCRARNAATSSSRVEKSASGRWREPPGGFVEVWLLSPGLGDRDRLTMVGGLEDGQALLPRDWCLRLCRAPDRPHIA